MCGICGIYNLRHGTSLANPEAVLKKMVNTLSHRGPDDRGFYIGNKTQLGHARLSIIDVAGGHQPIHNEDKLIWIVFNGEIYNYNSLRTDLVKRGHKFYTNSDTETIVHLYEEKGRNCIEDLRGTFAFALWDDKKEELLLVRDRLGIKPLFYTFQYNTLIFASEIKAILQYPGILRTINLKALDEFFAFKHIPEPNTIFKEIYKLPAGYFLSINKGIQKLESYWDIVFNEDNYLREQEYEEYVETLLKESVKMRLMSEVPLGVLLSGGIDSSSIVALMSHTTKTPIKTFTIGFKERRFDESRDAEIVAKHFNTEHHHLAVTPERIEELLPKLVWHFDEPFGDSSALPTYYVSKMAREYVTVALVGDGGDELFAGYTMYKGLKFAEIYKRLPYSLRQNLPYILESLPMSRNSLNHVIKVLKDSSLSLPEMFYNKNLVCEDSLRQSLYSNEVLDTLKKERSNPLEEVQKCLARVTASNEVNRLTYVDIRFHLLNDMLVKVDRMSMANSLEARVPFLDHKLIELCYSMPPNLRIKRFTSKYLLRKIMAKYLPKRTLKKKKQGFGIPLSQWFKNDLCDYTENMIFSKEGISKRFLNMNNIKQIIHLHKSGKCNYGEQIWLLLVFELWGRMFLENNGCLYL